MSVQALLAGLLACAPTLGSRALDPAPGAPAVTGASARGPRLGLQDPRGTPPQVRKGVDPKKLRTTMRDLELKAKAREKRKATAKVPIADAKQVREWFKTCDHNSNGWLSYSETAFSLRFTRGRFQAFDTDRDGRLGNREFDEFYTYSIAQSGQFMEPKGNVAQGPPPQRTPEQVRNAYDTDLDKLLSAVEVTRLLADYQRETAAPERVIKSLDASGDGMLALEELEGLHAVLYPILLEEDEEEVVADAGPPKPKTANELFGKVELRGTEPGATPSPPRIVGPVSHFRRLDLDNDGFISVDDLEGLLRPVRVAIRPHTVVNTLDANGDSRLSEEEFLGALVDVSK